MRKTDRHDNSVPRSSTRRAFDKSSLFSPASGLHIFVDDCSTQVRSDSGGYDCNAVVCSIYYLLVVASVIRPVTLALAWADE